MATQPVKYLQTDPRWASNDYSVKGETTNIKESGCGPTCAAMILATQTDASINPAQTCAWSLAKGYKALKQGTYYTYFAAQGKAYGLTWTQLNGSNLRNLTAAKAKAYHDKALAAVQSGDLVIACMGPGNWTSSGHFILWWKYENGYVCINDPASTAASREKNTLALLQAQVKYYFICKTPDTSKEEEEMTEAQKEALIKEAVEAGRPKVYTSVSAVPAWAQGLVQEAQEKGIIKGDQSGALALTDDRLVMLQMLKNAGAF